MTEKSNAPPGGRPKKISLPAAVTRRIEDLLRRHAVRELTRACRQNGQAAWIVGGAVRDLWLGRPIFDVDAALDGDPEPVARELERRGAGRCVALSTQPPRVYRLAGRAVELDLAQTERGSIERDLGRRDFTANAIALSLPGGEILDPFGGMVDLARHRLRAVAAKNFEDDPLRALRAARFLATHGLVPDRFTQRVCRAAAPGLAGVAAERVRTELARLLEAPRAAPALAWAARANLLPFALGLPVSDRIRRALARGRVAFDAPALRRLAPEARRRARLALLADALGLPASETSRWLSGRRWSREDAGAAAGLRELARTAGAARTAQAEWSWVREAGPRANEALAVIAARDRAGPRLARKLRRRLAAARLGPRVRGSDVLAWLGASPGPAVGKLLAAVEIAGLSGRVRTRGQARKWLVAQAPAIIRSS
jgi:tRNA nucleotidyltransferase/poly(A) polymerase